MLDKVGPVLWTAFALLAVYCVQTLRRWHYMRLKQFADFPQPGKPSLLWGHMRLLGEQFKKGDPRRHIGMYICWGLHPVFNDTITSRLTHTHTHAQIRH